MSDKESTNGISSSELRSFVDSLIFRIDGNYYDLTQFSDSHPGGKNILVWAKRKAWDHTQMFAIHHVNYTKASAIMNRFLIKDKQLIDRIHELESIEIPQRFRKQLPRSTSKHYPKQLIGSGIESHYESFGINTDNIDSKWSFDDLKMADCSFELPRKGSFYWELREEIYKYFKNNNTSYYPTTFYMTLWWIVAFLALASQVMQCHFKSYTLAVFTGLTYAFLGGYGHQFIHNPVHFRTYAYLCLDWIGLYSYQYMVDHVVVHHIHTNTIPDHHFDGTDPFLYVNPLIPRAYWRKVFKVAISLGTFAIGIHGNYIYNSFLILSGNAPFYASILIFPANYALTCWLVGDVVLGLALAATSTCVVSTWYFTIALMNHNQSENWDMDKLTNAAQSSSKNGGWAEMQLVTTTDIGYNYGFIGSMLCLWLNYHTVHHLLPTVDMSHHQQAQKILNRVSAKHGLSYSYKPIWDMYWDMLDTFSMARALNVMTET
eukprot:36479_1